MKTNVAPSGVKTRVSTRIENCRVKGSRCLDGDFNGEPSHAMDAGHLDAEVPEKCRNVYVLLHVRPKGDSPIPLR